MCMDIEIASVLWIRHTLEITTADVWISKLIYPHFIPTWEYSDDVQTCCKMKCESLPVQVSREWRSQTIMNGEYGMQSLQ